MKVGLFVPCYVDQLSPDVGMATVGVLEKLGVDLEFPTSQTCCGQPMCNAGSADAARPLAERFLEIFNRYDYVVCPSASCVATVRVQYAGLLPAVPEARSVISRTYELCEFLADVLKLDQLAGHFPHRVGIHQSCHGLRELRLASGPERRVPPFGKVERLLSGLRGIQLVELVRPGECCGFGGLFAIGEEAVSCAMGRDRIADHLRTEASIITSTDQSCLQHLQGLIARDGTPISTLHVAQILNQALSSPPPR
jgi:L-lactate dehydrogenase complex protein LldE